jgi:uncharacterized protein (DUF849 family)
MGQPPQRIPPIARMKACLNGQRGHDEHPAVPVTPAELAAAAAGAVAAGAEAIHVHPRDAGGRESLLAADVGAAVAAVRQACPGVAVGVTTGLWVNGGDPAARQAAVAGWVALPGEARPDFASVNLGEAGAADLPGALAAAGIAAEAGVWSPADADRLAAELPAGGPAAGWLWLMVEISGVPAAGAAAAADAVLRRLDELDVPLPRLLHGAGESCWPLIEHAGRLGLPARVGLEDTLTGPGGRPVSGNAELVELALAAWTAASEA